MLSTQEGSVSNSGQGTRSYKPQLRICMTQVKKILHATTKILCTQLRHSTAKQTNFFFFLNSTYHFRILQVRSLKWDSEALLVASGSSRGESWLLFPISIVACIPWLVAPCPSHLCLPPSLILSLLPLPLRTPGSTLGPQAHSRVTSSPQDPNIIICAKSLLMWKVMSSQIWRVRRWEYLSSVQSPSCVQLFVTPWTAAHQAPLSITNSQSLLKLMSI